MALVRYDSCPLAAEGRRCCRLCMCERGREGEKRSHDSTSRERRNGQIKVSVT